jgi:hypothetical protein
VKTSGSGAVSGTSCGHKNACCKNRSSRTEPWYRRFRLGSVLVLGLALASGQFFEPFGRPRECFGAPVDSPLMLFWSELDDSIFFWREPCDEVE